MQSADDVLSDLVERVMKLGDAEQHEEQLKEPAAALRHSPLFEPDIVQFTSVGHVDDSSSQLDVPIGIVVTDGGEMCACCLAADAKSAACHLRVYDSSTASWTIVADRAAKLRHIDVRDIQCMCVEAERKPFVTICTTTTVHVFRVTTTTSVELVFARPLPSCSTDVRSVAHSFDSGTRHSILAVHAQTCTLWKHDATVPIVIAATTTTQLWCARFMRDESSSKMFAYIADSHKQLLAYDIEDESTRGVYPMAPSSESELHQLRISGRPFVSDVCERVHSLCGNEHGFVCMMGEYNTHAWVPRGGLVHLRDTGRMLGAAANTEALLLYRPDDQILVLDESGTLRARLLASQTHLETCKNRQSQQLSLLQASSPTVMSDTMLIRRRCQLADMVLIDLDHPPHIAACGASVAAAAAAAATVGGGRGGGRGRRPLLMVLDGLCRVRIYCD